MIQCPIENFHPSEELDRFRAEEAELLAAEERALQEEASKPTRSPPAGRPRDDEDASDAWLVCLTEDEL